MFAPGLDQFFLSQNVQFSAYILYIDNKKLQLMAFQQTTKQLMQGCPGTIFIPFCT